MIDRGRNVDLYYYCKDNQVSERSGLVLEHDATGITIQDSGGRLLWFPNTSIQRVIIEDYVNATDLL